VGNLCLLEEPDSGLENRATLAPEPDASSDAFGWKVADRMASHRIAEHKTHRRHVAGKSIACDRAQRPGEEIDVDEIVLASRPPHAAGGIEKDAERSGVQRILHDPTRTRNVRRG